MTTAEKTYEELMAENDAMRAENAQHRATQERNERLGDITIVYDSRFWTPPATSRNPHPEEKHLKNIVVKGGVFGWKGLKLTPAIFDAIMELKADIKAVVNQNRSKFD